MSTENWCNGEVEALLGIVGEEDIQRDLDGAVRNQKTFIVISGRMKELGFDRTAEQCRAKLKKLRGDYRKVKDHNSRSGVHRKNWRWLDLMDAIYGNRPATQGRDATAESDEARCRSLVDGEGARVSLQGEESPASGPSEVDFRCSTPAQATTASSSSSSTPSVDPPCSPIPPPRGRETPPALSRTQQRSARRRRDHPSELSMVLRELQANDSRLAQLNHDLLREELERHDRARQEELRLRREDMEARQEERRARREERRARYQDRKEERRLHLQFLEAQAETARQKEARVTAELQDHNQFFSRIFAQGVSALTQGSAALRDTALTE
ncbi:trihelix transcription factor GT-3a-like [Salarias fasciatus]|uniref:Trihelix transcription factor GT-3a-like n=2 Tax=Salarias fasciatus TaxID=181472 RepID=A0A672HK69_SALFA|nr:trihelix transcription factor GT-3a-like [Salarias fasciatus]